MAVTDPKYKTTVDTVLGGLDDALRAAENALKVFLLYRDLYVQNPIWVRAAF